MKYTLEFKLECIERYKQSHSYVYPPGVKSKGSFRSHVQDWARLYGDLGIDGLRHSGTSKEWTAKERFGLVAKVLAGRSVKGMVREAHIGSGQLYQRMKRYREKGMKGLECRRGKPPKVPITPKKKTELTASEREAARPKARKRKSSKR